MADRIETFRVSPGCNEPYQEVTVRLVKSERNDYGNTYKAFVGEMPIGEIYKAMATFERSTKGRQDVNKRWQSLRWFGDTPYEWGVRGRLFDRETIGRATQDLAEKYLRHIAP